MKGFIEKVELRLVGFELKYLFFMACFFIPVIAFSFFYFVGGVMNALILSAISVFLTQVVMAVLNYRDYVVNYRQVIGKEEREFVRDKGMNRIKMFQICVIYLLVTVLFSIPLVCIISINL